MANKEELYSPDDIKKYLDGNMTAAEMHRLEKAALEDPFLADAMDGFRDAYTSADADQIPAMVKVAGQFTPNANTGQYRSIEIPVWQVRIMKYAVAAMVVGAAGWYLLRENGSQEMARENIATTTPDSSVAATAKTTAPKTINDTSSVAGNVAMNDNTRSDSKSKSLKNTVDANNQADVAVNTVKPAAIAPPVAAETQSGDIVMGRVTDQQNKPIELVSLSVKGSSISAITDDQGKFIIAAADSDAVIVASAPGYKTSERKASLLRNNALQLERSNASLSEIVVSNYAKRKKEIYDGQIEIDTAEALPSGGWQSFMNYLEKNNKYKQANKKALLVILSFEVDDIGRPVNIDITQSAGRLLDEEAVRLLKKGPIWINKTKSPSPLARITIVF